MPPLWPFPSCDWPPPGDLVVDRPDGSAATHNVAIIDVGDHLAKTEVSPGRVLIDWPGLGLETVGGPATAGIYTLAIGSNLVLSFPGGGVARLDATGGSGGGTIDVAGTPGYALDINPCLGIEFDDASGLALAEYSPHFGRVLLHEATPSQNGGVTTNPQSWHGLKTLLDGLTVGQPGPAGIGETMLSFLPGSLLAGGRAVLELLQAELTGGGGTDFSGQQLHADGSVLVAKGFTAPAVGGGGWNRTSLGVVDAGGTEYLGAWVPVPGTLGPPWVFTGGLYQGGLGALAFLGAVAGAGGGTGLTLTSSTTGATITLTLGGTLAIANGGSGATTPAGALANLLPPQGGHAGQFLTTNGTVASWAAGGGGGLTASQAFDAIQMFG